MFMEYCIYRILTVWFLEKDLVNLWKFLRILHIHILANYICYLPSYFFKRGPGRRITRRGTVRTVGASGLRRGVNGTSHDVAILDVPSELWALPGFDVRASGTSHDTTILDVPSELSVLSGFDVGWAAQRGHPWCTIRTVCSSSLRRGGERHIAQRGHPGS